jgi:phospholipase D1/2
LDISGALTVGQGMTEKRRRARLKIYATLGVLVVLALAAAWQWTPLREYADPRLLARLLLWMAHSAWTPVIVIAAYVLSNLVMFPITVLCFATILVWGTHPGLLYATVGSLIAALAAYAGGRYYGARPLQRLENGSLARLTAGLRQGGIVQMTILRLLPLAPFSIVNVMAGAARVRVIPFSIGTILGMLPGNLLFTAFGRQLRQLISNPTPLEVATLVAVTIVVSAAFWYLHRLTLSRTPASH